jgi:hypothetical protein
LIFTSFFFWKPGSALQNSLAGLFRSLLHDILKQRPELIPQALPHYWNELKSSSWHGSRSVVFQKSHIQEAFFRLISDGSLYKEHCFCFWIDGLDEYEGTYQNDSKTLIDLLCRWTTYAPNNIKMCVSSREYNVFMNALSTDQRIRLHELTKADMEHYVMDKLGHMESKSQKSVITERIIENACGMFLWVVIVVRRIREKIEDGNDIDSLLCELDSLPRELDGLFMHILDSLPEVDLKMAYRTCLMVMRLAKFACLRLPLLAYSYLNEYMNDPRFAMEVNFPNISVDLDWKNRQETSALKMLNGCCKGLIEAAPAISRGTSILCLTLTHRSISEFIAYKSRLGHIDRLLEGFNPVDAISQLILASLKQYPAIIKDGGEALCLICVTRLRIENELDSPPYQFLESMAAAISQYKSEYMDMTIGFEHTDVNMQYHGPDLAAGIVMLGGFPLAALTKLPGLCAPHDPIYTAAMHGNTEYVRWRLKTGDSEQSLVSMETLLHCMLYLPESNQIESFVNTVEAMFTDGGLTPDMISEIGIASWVGIYQLDSQDQIWRRTQRLGIWWHILIACLGWNRDKLQLLGYVIARFLKHGADPNFQLFVLGQGIQAPVSEVSNESTLVEAKVRQRRRQMPEQLLPSKESEGGYCVKLVLGVEKMEILLKNLNETGIRDAHSLSQLIELLDFENKHYLQLLAKESLERAENRDRVLENIEAKTYETHTNYSDGVDLAIKRNIDSEIEPPPGQEADEGEGQPKRRAQALTIRGVPFVSFMLGK